MASEQRIVNKKNCPVCGRDVLLAKAISETGNAKDAGLWYWCSCGVIYNETIPKREPKDKEYLAKYIDAKQYDEKAKLPVRVYAPIIEELTMGRKALDVGYCVPNTMQALKERGWVTFGIDNNKDSEESDRLIKDDFETTEKLYKNTYDLVWMGHVLEKFKDPLSALWRTRDILQNNGVLYISTPDIDFLYSKPHGEWTHWNKEDNNIMWSERSLRRELERLGLNIIVCRRNYYSRYGFYHDLHVICQKTYF